MSALDRLGDLGGWRGFRLFCCLMASGDGEQRKKDEAQLDEIRRLGT